MKKDVFAAPLVLVLAGTCLADATLVSTIAAGPAASDAAVARRPDVAAGTTRARVTPVAGADGRVVDGLTIEFPSARGAAAAPLVVFTREAAARIDLADVAWDGADAGVRRAALVAAAATPAVPIEKHLAELAWAAGVVDLLPTLDGAAAGRPLGFVIEPVSVPEPGAAALFALGAAGLAVVAWRRRCPRPNA